MSERRTVRNMEIVLIRHGATAGNIEKRYIGTTDEPLCDTGMVQACVVAVSVSVPS